MNGKFFEYFSSKTVTIILSFLALASIPVTLYQNVRYGYIWSVVALFIIVVVICYDSYSQVANLKKELGDERKARRQAEDDLENSSSTIIDVIKRHIYASSKTELLSTLINLLESQERLDRCQAIGVNAFVIHDTTFDGDCHYAAVKAPSKACSCLVKDDMFLLYYVSSHGLEKKLALLAVNQEPKKEKLFFKFLSVYEERELDNLSMRVLSSPVGHPDGYIFKPVPLVDGLTKKNLSAALKGLRKIKGGELWKQS